MPRSRIHDQPRRQAFARVIAALLFVCALICLQWLLTHNPADPGVGPPCPTMALTGLICPGCGTLTAWHALLHGRFAEAWTANPAAVITAPLLIWFSARSLRYITVGRAWTFPATLLPPHIVLGALVLWTVARNI